VIVGVNRFESPGDAAPADILRIDPALEAAQIERVRALRARRAPRPGRRRSTRSSVPRAPRPT
jgi:methylmalonyl-CoA mutase N-terminal domain/subunit